LKQELPFVFNREVKLKRSSLVVGWVEDVGRLGPTVIDYLVTKLGAQQFAEVDPNEFFSLGGGVGEREADSTFTRRKTSSS
jgi:proteasome assembly chaperone (PAC2) family protein